MAFNVLNSDKAALAISVVVCTFNREKLLGTALQSLCDQRLDPLRYEVIVVDNNSTDKTQALTENYARRFRNLRYCVERQQGLSHARNHGWRVARAAYVAYMDDDCQAPEQWLSIAGEIIGRLSPAVFGGPYYPFYNSLKPAWWKDSYASCEHAECARALKDGEWLSGGNIFFQRNLLETLRGFNAELGMSGGKIGVGEETELLERIRATVPSQLIYYDPKLYLYHLVRPEKMNLWWTARKRFIEGRDGCLVFVDRHRMKAGPVSLLKQAVQTVKEFVINLMIGPWKRDRKEMPYPQNYWYEHSFQHLVTLGRLYQEYRNLILRDERQ